MAKSRAEIQRAYRERQKAKNNEEYLRKERERRKKGYVPSDKLTKRERLRRNMKGKEAVKRHRQLKRDEALAVLEEHREEMETSGYESMDRQYDPRSPEEPGPSHNSPSQFLVRMPFPNRKNGPRKRIARTLAKKSRQVSKLKQDLDKLKTKHKTTQRRLQRLRRKIFNKEPMTPKSKTEAQIKEARLDNDQAKKVRKQLLVSNVVMDEVRSAKEQNNPGKARILHNVVAGGIVRKYRCASVLSKWTGLSRNKLNKAGKMKSKILDYTKQARVREVMRFKRHVIDFLERDDNSRNMPGKADKVKTAPHESTQKRVLTDYLSNLHAKFVSENPTIKLSLASFQRIRPKYILTTSFITRNCCLCTKHQNMALVLKAVRQIGVGVPSNPETYAANPTLQQIRDQIDSPEFTFEEWKRVSVDDKGKTKMVMRVVRVTKTKEDFLAYLERQTTEFSDHVSRMKEQYAQIRILKEKLPVHNVVVHMDFAENYSCKSVEEIQSAYWNQTGVTLHPTVIYTRPTEESEMQHQSYVIISDDQHHNATSVTTFLKTIVNDVKSLDPNVKCIHYWTDSPTSQYRNKTILHLVANHQETFGMSARWNYFEAGHGKGPCDGLGGSTKRMADEAVNSGKLIIQDAADFFAWTQSIHCTMKQVKFRFIKKEQCQETEREIALWNTKPVKGTMKLHAVVGRGSNVILVGNVSCYCVQCLEGNNFCNLWRRETTKPDVTAATVPLFNNPPQELPVDHNVESLMLHIQSPLDGAAQATDNGSLTPPPSSVDQDSGASNLPEISSHSYSHGIDDFVVALYEGNWYVGKIIDTDPNDEFEFHISFMEQKKRMFGWPKSPDTIWCMGSDILFRISEPQPSGKSKRLFGIGNEVWEKIDTLQ